MGERGRQNSQKRGEGQLTNSESKMLYRQNNISGQSDFSLGNDRELQKGRDEW